MTTKITTQEVRKVAYLARLTHDPSPEFLKKFSEELNSILSYVEEINQVDVSSTNPLAGSRVNSLSALRKDEPVVDLELYNRVRESIINNFPEKQNNLLTIPGIFQ